MPALKWVLLAGQVGRVAALGLAPLCRSVLIPESPWARLAARGEGGDHGGTAVPAGDALLW